MHVVQSTLVMNIILQYIYKYINDSLYSNHYDYGLYCVRERVSLVVCVCMNNSGEEKIYKYIHTHIYDTVIRFFRCKNIFVPRKSKKIIFTNITKERIIHATCQKFFVQFDLHKNYFTRKFMHENLLNEKSELRY